MKTQEAYRMKREAELNEMKANLQKWKAQIKQEAAENKVNFDRKIQEIETEVAALQGQLDDMVEAGSDTLDDLKASVEEKWTDLHETFNALSSELSNKLSNA